MISTRSTLIMAESLLKYYSVSILVNALYVPWLWSSDRRELPRVGSARTGGRPPTGASWHAMLQQLLPQDDQRF